jgi:hypothetical protein
VVGAIAAGLLFLLAFTLSGARSLGRGKGHPDYSSVALRAGVGAAIALAVGVAALVAVRVVADRDNAVARALVPERPITTRALVARSLPWLVVLLALGAVLGASTAPLYRAGTSARDDTTGRSVDPRLPEVESRLVQDEEGNVHVQADLDGDGRYETLVPCETSANGAPPAYGPEPEPGEPLLVPIDYECDGTIDAYARLDSLDIQGTIDSDDIGSAPLPRPGDPSRGGFDAPPPDTGDGTRDGGRDGDGGGGGGLPLPVIVLLIMAGGAALVALAWYGGRSLLEREAPQPEPEPDDTAAATGAIVSSLGVVNAPLDPRAAIINAYARLLDGLAAGGMPRRESETPEQYLRRCVDQWGVPREPMEELTALFTLARFSTHPIDETQRAEAVACLEQSLADLRRRAQTAAPAEPVPS